jgi:hypothetical protein
LRVPGHRITAPDRHNAEAAFPRAGCGRQLTLPPVRTK